jgi:uncharacterized membrane protein
MLAIQFYDVVVALHVMAIVIAFGVIFAYPAFVPHMVAKHPHHLPAIHAIQSRVGRTVIAPFGGIALLLGIYLATDAHVWSKVWVTVPLVILLLLLGAGGMYFSKTEDRLEQLARRDVGVPAAGGALSDEYMATYRTWQRAAYASCLLVLVAIFFMVAKPG